MAALPTGVLDHLWQSSLVAALVLLLTLTLRHNGARLRFWLWFAASVKFLLPFALLSGLGAMLSRIFPALPSAPLVLKPALQFSTPARLLPVAQDTHVMVWICAAWVLGFAAVVTVRLVQDARLRAILAQARTLPSAAGVPVKTAPHLLEPGLVGLLKPVVLLPDGLLPRLSCGEADAILAHELAHARSRDNLLAAIHMAVESLFWFWPPVWWIGARLIAEREIACDERVLDAGHDPETYAGAILKVCRFCLKSPLACVSGATGSHSGSSLKRRVARIMTGGSARDLAGGQMLLLAGALLATLVLPVMAGFAASPLVQAVRVQVAAQLVQIVPEALVDFVAPEAPPLPHLRPVNPIRLAMPELPQPAPAPQSAPAMAPVLAAAPGPAAVLPANPAPKSSKDALLALWPTGAGDPDAMTCRTPKTLPGSRLAGPQVCRTNGFWARLRANGEEFTADGRAIVASSGSLMTRDASTKPCTQTPGLPGNNTPPTYCF